MIFLLPLHSTYGDQRTDERKRIAQPDVYRSAESNDHPFVIRYPRGEGVMPDWKTPFEEITIGKGRKLKDGDDIAILTLGHPGNFATTAIRELRTEGLNPAHYDMRFAKPLDEPFYTKCSASMIRSSPLKMVPPSEEWAVLYWNSWRSTITVLP